MREDGGLRLRNERFDDFVHGFLHLNVALFRHLRWCDRLAGVSPLHRAVDEEAGAIRALDLPCRAEIEIDPRMAERTAAAIAGSDRLVDVDGFERTHMRPGSASDANNGRLTV